MIALQRRHVVGLGRGKEDAIDARAKQDPQNTAPAETKCCKDRLKRQPLIAEGRLTGVECTQYVNEDDLAINPARELGEEGLHDNLLVGFETCFHQCGHAALPRMRTDRERYGAKPQQRRIGDLSWVQEPPRLQQAQLLLGPTCRKKSPIEVVRLLSHLRLADAVRRVAREKVEPVPGERGTW